MIHSVALKKANLREGEMATSPPSTGERNMVSFVYWKDSFTKLSSPPCRSLLLCLLCNGSPGSRAVLQSPATGPPLAPGKEQCLHCQQDPETLLPSSPLPSHQNPAFHNPPLGLLGPKIKRDTLMRPFFLTSYPGLQRGSLNS